MAMITITFQPETPAQAALVGQMMVQYLNVTVEQAEPARAAAEHKLIEKLNAQQQADLDAAEVNRADDAARADLQAKRDAAKKPKGVKAAPTPAAEETAQPEAAEPAPAAASPSSPVGLVEVRAKLAALSQAGKADQVKALLKKYGATKLTEVDEHSYLMLLDDAEALA